MKAIKSIFCVMLSLVLFFSSVFTLAAYASTANYRYLERGVLTDGTNTAYYFIDKDRRELYLTGDGLENARTPDYPNAESGPFAGRTDVTKIIIEEDVARVGDYVFANMTAVDTLEVQSNLLSSESDMSGKAMIGCTALRHIQGESAFLSTDVLLEVVKGAVNAFSGNWVQLALNGFNIARDGLSGNTLPDEEVAAIVNDYIATGEEVFLGEYSTLQESYEQRMACPCYHENAYHHNYSVSVSKAATCTECGKHYYHCPNCGDAYYLDDIEPLGHNYVSNVILEPKCTEVGVVQNHCTRCNSNTYSEIAATGHQHGTWTVTVMAVPGARGTLKMLCDDCNAEMQSKTFNMVNGVLHDYKVGIDPANNTADGIKTQLAANGYIFYIQRGTTELKGNDLVGTGAIINSIRPTAASVSRVSTVILYGDVDGNGMINDTDRQNIKQYAFFDSGSIQPGTDYEKAADLNGDGAVDAFDWFLCDGIVTGGREFDQTVDYVN